VTSHGDLASIDRLIGIAGAADRVHTVVDVGANDGRDSLGPATRHPEIRFLAIEPTPALAREIRRESASLDNYELIECAVGSTEGSIELKIREHSGHNSLGDIDRSNVRRARVAAEVYDVRETTRVDLRRLDALCAERGIDRIDVLHVDAQGADFDVLVSAGELLTTVRVGVVEVPRRLALYENTAGRAAFSRLLRSHGLRVVDVRANDHLNLEQNLVFAPASGLALMLGRLSFPVLLARAEIAFLLWRVRDAMRVRLARIVAAR
jgi:FkbM family methyltransferase